MSGLTRRLARHVTNGLTVVKVCLDQVRWQAKEKRDEQCDGTMKEIQAKQRIKITNFWKLEESWSKICHHNCLHAKNFLMKTKGLKTQP